MTGSGRMFRIFVSSTFSDLQQERNALQDEVYPRLREFCQQRGVRFQAVDLRWGVSHEASQEQHAISICLQEIGRCQRVSPRLSFMILLGNRYGARPLPEQIPAGEYTLLTQQLSPEELARVQQWYRLDKNALPSAASPGVYCLQPRTGEYADAQYGYDKWAIEEQELRLILLHAFDPVQHSTLPPSVRRKFEASATETEILAGAIEARTQDQEVFCFFREIENLDDLKHDALHVSEAQSFIDLDTRSHQIDAEAQARLEQLKLQLRERYPNTVRTYSSHWTGAGITYDHLRALCDDVYTCLSTSIERILADEPEATEAQTEGAAHVAFGRDRMGLGEGGLPVFEGRQDLVDAVEQYCLGGEPHLMMVFGDSGIGKSALMAYAADAVKKQHPNVRLVARFVGATPNSVDVRTLLTDLCRAISEQYGRDTSGIPTDLQELSRELSKRLTYATREHPLIVFIDALDQLGREQSQPQDLLWLPATLPPYVHMVCSMVSGQGLDMLRQRLASAHFVDIKPLSREDGNNVLSHWLDQVQRTLQPEQQAEILDKFTAHGLPLYLRFAFEQARHWHSYSATPSLSPDVPGIMRDLFDELAKGSNHGQVLVSYALGYLGAARRGLAEDELLDALSSSNEHVMLDFRARQPNSPPVDRLPDVIWSRLYFDLAPYLIEISSEGGNLLTFYHQQLVEAVAKQYLRGSMGQARHRELAAYFAFPPNDTVALVRCLDELPYQQTEGEQWDAVFKTLTDFTFLEQKATHVGVLEQIDLQGHVTKTFTGVYQLQEDYNLVLAKMPRE